MTTSEVHELAHFYRSSHTALLEFVETTTDEQLRWQATPETPPMLFHFWHLVRWDDGLYAWLQRKLRNDADAEQLWKTGNYAQAWGFPADLGEYETGKSVESAAVAHYPYPDRATLLDYANQVFANITSAIEYVDELSTQPPETLDEQTLTNLGYARQNVVGFMTHIHRHLGCMEALKGILTGRGMKV